MAKVSLRIYNQEIEGLVDRGQLDEANAHCRHILNAFPKNLGTYRLLGKAYLEAKRYKEATDIFERVLMAVPDDFVAHVGMSIINDEQKSMDAAIWHMERAFEVQPSNAAIQSELQRLYGRRDGIEPPKIRLTRGALAHMYVQGELYLQAISEINSVLEEDPGRQDMQVLLARAYFHAGQKGEAAEICSQLLRRYPYNLDANRVLVELLPQTERGESTQVYRHRINELDPYATFTTGSVFHTEEVPDAAVNLERLEWDGQPIDVQPEWSDSLGIRKGDSASSSGNEEPDWLKAGLDDSPFSASAPTSEPASASGEMPIPAEDGDDEIPDFMRAAGWGENTGTFQEGLGAFDDGGTFDDNADAIVEGDMPDWVKAMAPEGSAPGSALPPASLDDDLAQDDVTDWLRGLGDVQDDKPAEQQPQAEAADLPDWLAPMEPEGESQPESQEEPEEVTAVEADLPDWLASIEPEGEAQSESQEEPKEISAVEADLPDWLASIEPEGEAQSESQEEPEEVPAVEADIPDWLASMEPEGESQEEPEEVPAVEADIPDWLASMEPEGEAQPESQEEPEEAPSIEADIPDWLNPMQSEEQAVSDEPIQDIPETTPGSLSDWQIDDELSVASADAGGIGMSTEEQDDAVAWLEGLAANHGAKPEELVTDPEARKETAPDWVQKSQADQEQDVPEEFTLQEEMPQEQFPVEEEPVQQVEDVSAMESETVMGASAQEQDDAVAWLEGLAAKHGAKPEEMVTDPNARKETAPDWVQRSQAEQEQGEPEAAAPQEQFLMEEEPVQAVEDIVAPADASGIGMSMEEQDDAVAWLEGLAANHGAKPEELITDPNSRKETAPDWVQRSQAEQEQAEPEEFTPQEEFPQEQFPAEEEPVQPVEEVITPESEIAMGVSSQEQDDAVAWLEGLAAKHGAKPEEMVTDPESRKETAPDWVQKESEAAAEQPAIEEPAPVEETPESEPDWMTHAKEVGESLYAELEDSQTKESLPAEGTDETGMWLRDMGQEAGFADDQSEEPVADENSSDWFAGLDTDELDAKTAPVAEAAPVPEIEAESDVPDWLRGLETESTDPASMDAIPANEPGDNDLPSWLSGLDDDVKSQQPAETDGSLLKWLDVEDEQEPVPLDPEPITAVDWKPVEEIEPSPLEELPVPESTPEPPPPAPILPEPRPQPKQPEPKPEPAVPAGRPAYMEPVTRSRSGMTGMLSAAQEPLLVQAQNELTRSNIPAAMDSYGKLIKKGKMLEEVIFDLREALYRYPVEVSIMQTLGDAYMRANRLQDALDAYTKAEELLR